MSRHMAFYTGSAAVLIVTLVSLIACGNTDLPSQSEAIDAATADLEDDPWLRIRHGRKWSGDLDGMIERGFVRLLVIPSGTFYFLDGARERGVHAEYRLAFEQFLNRKYKGRKNRISVVTIPVRRDELIPTLLQGQGDVGAGNLTVTPERESLVEFTNQRLENVRELVLLAPDQPDLSGVEDLSGREVYVRRSSSYFESLEGLNERLRKEGRPPIKIRMADEYLEDEHLAEMVNASLLPATVMDRHKWEPLWSKLFTKVKVNPEVFIRDEGETAPIIRKGSPQLMAVLDEFYKNHGSGTGFFNTVANRYRSTRWISDATATTEQKKFDAAVGHFRKYGDQYKFDYLMLAAQGYQESALDQNARSPRGAIGVMQLMPATAKRAPILIPNVEELEPNIHAGTKYLRYVVDEYFDDPAIDEVNRLLFAFAGYNVGPGRIAKLRTLAPEYGFDPNRWFNNVEHIVATKVGQEPVRYVSNIYKYYVAYRRLRELEEETNTPGHARN